MRNRILILITTITICLNSIYAPVRAAQQTLNQQIVNKIAVTVAYAVAGIAASTFPSKKIIDYISSQLTGSKSIIYHKDKSQIELTDDIEKSINKVVNEMYYSGDAIWGNQLTARNRNYYAYEAQGTDTEVQSMRMFPFKELPIPERYYLDGKVDYEHVAYNYHAYFEIDGKLYLLSSNSRMYAVKNDENLNKPYGTFDYIRTENGYEIFVQCYEDGVWDVDYDHKFYKVDEERGYGYIDQDWLIATDFGPFGQRQYDENGYEMTDGITVMSGELEGLNAANAYITKKDRYALDADISSMVITLGNNLDITEENVDDVIDSVQSVAIDNYNVNVPSSPYIGGVVIDTTNIKGLEVVGTDVITQPTVDGETNTGTDTKDNTWLSPLTGWLDGALGRIRDLLDSIKGAISDVIYKVGTIPQTIVDTGEKVRGWLADIGASIAELGKMTWSKVTSISIPVIDTSFITERLPFEQIKDILGHWTNINQRDNLVISFNYNKYWKACTSRFCNVSSPVNSDNYVLIDMKDLNEKYKVPYVDVGVVDFTRDALGMGMMLTTILFVWHTIVDSHGGSGQ